MGIKHKTYYIFITSEWGKDKYVEIKNKIIDMFRHLLYYEKDDDKGTNITL